VESCVIVQRPTLEAELTPGRDLDWSAAMAAATPHGCRAVRATDPLYILYTSGTTGTPKGVVRDNGGHAVALAWSMRHVYGLEPGEVFWAASDIGWVVGHSYIVYGPLLCGMTTVLYEGKPVGTPDAGTFWRVIEQHGVVTLFTAPTAFRVIKQHDHAGERIAAHDLSRLRALFLAGERCDPDTLHWAQQLLGIPVVDHWWQTETGWPVTASCLGLDTIVAPAGSAGRAVPGWDLRVVDESGTEVPAGTSGEIVCRLPLPPGSLPTLWRAEERFRERYLDAFPGCYRTDDAGYVDEDGWVYVMSRLDDIINVAGHRLSTGAMEEVLDEHPDVCEAAVIGVADEVKGQLPVGFLVLEHEPSRTPADIVEDVVRDVRARIGPVASFRLAAVVARLPKTRSGKVLRGTMRRIADGEPFRVPPTIEDPEVLDEIRTVLRDLGFPRTEE
jgi:propionyl-CoA synthetase